MSNENVSCTINRRIQTWKLSEKDGESATEGVKLSGFAAAKKTDNGVALEKLPLLGSAEGASTEKNFSAISQAKGQSLSLIHPERTIEKIFREGEGFVVMQIPARVPEPLRLILSAESEDPQKAQTA